MTERAKQLVIVRGGGDIATGTIHRLYRCGYPVLVLESGYPSAIRRCVAFSEAVYDGTSEVEGITCIKASGYEEACAIMEQGAAQKKRRPQYFSALCGEKYEGLQRTRRGT